MTEHRHDPALHELDPTGRFTSRAADYARHRPDYPAAALDCVLDGLSRPDATALRVADVGAGTGISSRALAERGVRVIAVEPNAAMRDAAEPREGVEWRDGAAESTGLPAGSADLVFCAQAFHWFRQSAAVAEFHRVLRPGGRLAIVWNRRDHGDPMTLGFIDAIREVGGEHPSERWVFDPSVVDARGEFTPAVLHLFPHAQALDRSGLLGRATSASYAPREGPALADLTRRLSALFDEHRDASEKVTLRYRTEVWLAERR
jgi:SAM-dependent methyltransferase